MFHLLCFWSLIVGMSDVSTKARQQKRPYGGSGKQQVQNVGLLGLSSADDGHNSPKKNLDWDGYIRLRHIIKTEKK